MARKRTDKEDEIVTRYFELEGLEKVATELMKINKFRTRSAIQQRRNYLKRKESKEYMCTRYVALPEVVSECINFYI